MTSKQSETNDTPKTGDNSLVEHDVILAEASKVVAAWNKADKTLANADAAAVHVMLRASEFGFFSTVKPSTWHTIATQPLRNEFADVVLIDLFGIEKPTSADRQRLQRIKLVVPAIIKSGGLAAIEMSASGSVMLDTTTEYFKACVKAVEATGKMAVSIAKLNKGAAVYLKGEIVSTGRAPQTQAQKRAAAKADKDRLPTMRLVTLAKTMTDKIAGKDASVLSHAENKQLQKLLVQLLGVFAVDNAGLDVEKVTTIYSKVS